MPVRRPTWIEHQGFVDEVTNPGLMINACFGSWNSDSRGIQCGSGQTCWHLQGNGCTMDL